MIEEKSLNFLEEVIEEDLKNGKYKQIITRFPPEPNGYLHIGHAKSICLNFGLTKKYSGYTNLRFDDTNPVTEDTEYVESIKDDVRWLGFNWKNELYASDYFANLYEYALRLIRKGLAYVDDSTSEEIAKMKGTPTEPGKDSPFRNRSAKENEDLFVRMKNGEFPDGTRTLRAKIDMASPNMLMRDPVLYRIKHAHHHRTGDEWCIYPMYDMAHGQSDSIEKVTHSICTLEFIPHRELYDWLIEKLELFPSHQYEFARLNLTYTVMSKRKLLELVEQKQVSGWDDPRLPTIKGLRRRGYTPESIRSFCEHIGVAKRDATVEMPLLESFVREDLNRRARRVMAVLRPLKVVIENYPEEQIEHLDAINNPEDASMGTRQIPFSRVIYIEQDDFREQPPKKFYRLSPGQEVRLRYAYIIRCTTIVKDERTGEIMEVRCTYDPATRSGSSQEGRKVKGTIHWVSATHALTAEVRIYDALLLDSHATVPAGADSSAMLNPHSLERITGCLVEPGLADASPNNRYQFERQGYFCMDPDSSPDRLIFNRTVPLRDSWAKIEKSQQTSTS